VDLLDVVRDRRHRVDGAELERLRRRLRVDRDAVPPKRRLNGAPTAAGPARPPAVFCVETAWSIATIDRRRPALRIVRSPIRCSRRRS
jgi:hypothetical protein